MSTYYVETEELEDGGMIIHVDVPEEDIKFWVEKGLMAAITEAVNETLEEYDMEDDEYWDDVFLDYGEDELLEEVEEEYERQES